MHHRFSILLLLSFIALPALSGCSMREEMRRIDEVKRARQNAAASRSTNLTGEQIFIRSCNTCHIDGEKSPQAPTLIDMDTKFPEDAALKAFLRKGKGNMPPLPVSIINDEELNNLVGFLRPFNVELHEIDTRRKAREEKRRKEKEEQALLKKRNR